MDKTVPNFCNVVNIANVTNADTGSVHVLKQLIPIFFQNFYHANSYNVDTNKPALAM